MKIFLTISRIIVGVLFIFSGLIKANDPLGLSYKMQEFFEVWNWDFLNDYTLTLSVVMNAFEIIAGVAILLGWRIRIFAWLLQLLIIFFTFLTGYALFSGKIRECGCFGDCIPLQAGQSFLKDLVLLLLILVIFINRNHFADKVKTSAPLILGATTLFAFIFQWHVLRHLPVLDCLPYKKGNNILEQMKAPAGSIPDSTVIEFTYAKNGKELSFTADQFPADFDDSYTFVKRQDKVVRKGTAVPKIRDFSLQTVNGTDTTAQLLSTTGYQLFLFVREEFGSSDFETVYQKAKKKNIPSFIVTNLQNFKMPLSGSEQPVILYADGTAIKTAARHNPTLFLLKGGTIIHKWAAPDFGKAVETINDFK